MAVLPELPKPGEHVDRYRVIAPVATGGMAAVYAVQRSSIGGFDKLLALKVILPHLASERYFLDMFLDEARIASQIQHANVVGVFDVVEHHGLPCMVMEYLHGRSFSSVLTRPHEGGPACPPVLRVAILAAAAEGLAAAHRACGRDGLPLGVIHRDVSPQNVHVGYDGQVRLVDFGIAAARGRLSSTRAGTLKGKLDYLAPEQITGSDRVTAKVDVWSFGVMAWQALTERRLFTDDNDAATMWNVVNREVPGLDPALLTASMDDDGARAVTSAIMGCLRREPAERIDLDACARILREAAARCIADPRAAIGAHMVAAFADAKQADDEALERTLSHAQLAISEPASAGPAEVRADVIAPRVRRRWWLPVVGSIGLGAVIALALATDLPGAIGARAATAVEPMPARDDAPPRDASTALATATLPVIAPTPVPAAPLVIETPAVLAPAEVSPATVHAPERTSSPAKPRSRRGRGPRASSRPSEPAATTGKKRLFGSPYQ